MTVAELIALLQTMPQELPVTVYSAPAGAFLTIQWAEEDDRGYRVSYFDAEDTPGPHVRIG